MEDNLYDKTRRDFIKLTSVAAFALHPTVSALARWLKVDKTGVEKCFHDDEFHYFGNNLTNLHFYFINAKIEGKRLNQCPNTSEAFMVVKIPQQHVQEQLLREKSDPSKGGFDPDYINSDKRTESKISGFSFLAFKLFPIKVTVQSKDKGTITVSTKRKPFVDLSDINNLLNWNNSTLYELLIPTKDDYESFKQPNWDSFRDNDERLINDNENKPSKDYICNLYKKICDEVFIPKGDGLIPKVEFFPLTVLEIPEGLLVTPYSQDGKTLFADTYRIPKTRFVFNGTKGKIIRTVEEIWSTQMFFDTVEGRQSPPLRGVGYIPRKDQKPIRDKDECPKDPKEDVIYLPTLLDKNEIVYLSSLGRKDNEGKEWNIETRGLTLTGLGAIAKFHYKNLTSPCGSDLVEYEHHFTLGRDEYIKVARIGVISVTGQRALHVKIGQRKIKNGISYMEFKEYIEIIQKEIIYFDEGLFIEKKLDIKEPFNYIQARKNKARTNIIHSYDDIYYDYKDDKTPKTLNEDPNNDVWFDRYLWSLQYIYDKDDSNQKPINYLPQKWNTSYKRWCFKKVLSVKFVTQPITTDARDAKENILVSDDKCLTNPLAFWPILELDKTDAKLSFKGIDWNGSETTFESTFIFVRKSFIEGVINDASLKAIYENFINGRKERRTIQLNSEVAYTFDYSPKNSNQETLSNKSNVAKTEFVEYYFCLCRESNGNLLELIDGKIIEKGNEQIGCIFNDRVFPLFPQIKEAKLFVENIQSYTPEPLPSIIEYNEDFINYGFERTKPVFDIGKSKDVDVVYNKARLIFNHTERFRSNKVLENVNGLWLEKADEGYKRIKEAFGGAGNAIGGLVNPDFDIQSIGLVKQSIAVGKDINKKYEQVTDFKDKIEKFNPSDLLRQAPEIFNGISLIDILQEVFPEYEAPINDIKNVASQVEQLSDTLLSGLDDLKKIINDTKRDLLALKNGAIEDGIEFVGFETIQRVIQEKENQLKDIKNELNFKYQYSDLSNLIESVQSYSSIIGLEYDKKSLTINPAKIKVDQVSKSIANQLLSKIEIIQKLQIDITTDLNNRIAPFPQFKSHYDILSAKYNIFITSIFKDVTKPDLGIKLFDEIIGRNINEGIQYLINEQLKDLKELAKNQGILDAEKTKLINGHVKEVSKTIMTNFENAKIKFEKPLKDIQSSIQTFKDAVNKEINEIENDVSRIRKERDKKKLELLAIESKVRSIYEVILSVELSFIVESFDIAKKEYEIAKSKIGQIDELTKKPKISIADLNSLIDNRSILEAAIEARRDNLIKYYNTEEFKALTNVNQIINGVNNEVKKHEEVFKKEINKIWSVVGAITELREKIKSIENELYNNVLDNVNGYKELLQKRIKQYENKLKEQLSQEAAGVVGLLKKKIQNIENQIISEPDREDLKILLVQAKQLYNTLTSLSKKEINYTWQTSSFKNADFGIVSFLASNNPKTSLSVNVKNTIYFQPNKFPAIIQRIDSIAENRLNNFGISLLKAIIINFNEVSFIAGTNQSPKFEVKIRDVQFAGAFSFVQALESIFKKLLGDNFSVRISPQNVEIEYLLPIAYLGAPSFGFKDILFKIIYTLYFNKKPMELGVGIGTPENRTKLSVGIYTGLFYFIVIGNPKQGITTIEVSIEFGGYFGLSLGPLRGEVKLVVGLYYRKDLSGVIIEGYFLCEGRVKLWFIMITARFYMGVRSQGGYVEGRCTVSYEIRLGRFFKRSFTANYYKKVAGASPGNNASGNNQKYLDKYNLLNVTNLSSQETLTNPVERIVSPLTRDEWSIFINSYID